MIEPLVWDSNFFGYPVGRLQHKAGETINWSKVEVVLRDFHLVYLFSEEPIEVPMHITALLVDRKAVFIKSITDKSIAEEDSDTRPLYFNQKADPYNELLELALLSGHLSRFNVDPNFRHQEFKRLYKKWIDNSLSEMSVLPVLIWPEGTKIAGFVSVGEKAANHAQIGLIAVSPHFQRKGIARKLLEQAEREAAQREYTSISVVTQSENRAAFDLYERCGYHLESQTYIYHLWNKEYLSISPT